MKKILWATCCLLLAVCACKRAEDLEPDSNEPDGKQQNGGKEQTDDPETPLPPEDDEAYAWTLDPDDAWTSMPFVQVKVTKGNNPTNVTVTENAATQNRSAQLDMTGYRNPNFRKRGICYNNVPQGVAEEMARGGVTWGYNWASTPSNNYIGKGKTLNYYPMQWGDFSNITALENNIKNSNADVLLGFNEPMMTGKDGGCTMTPTRAAELWPQLELLVKKYNMKLASPALTYGYEKVGGVVYGSPEAWMDKFINEYKRLNNGRKPRFDYITLHSYMNWPGAVTDYVSKYAKRYGVKSLLTEFCAWEQDGGEPWNNINKLEKELFPDFSFQQASMTQKVEAMDQNPNVAGYAWFIANGNADKTPWNALFSGSTSTEIGKVYSFMSTSNTEKYYQPDVFIPAAQYVTSCNYNMSQDDAYGNRIIYGTSTDTEFSAVLPVEIRRFKSPCFANYLINVPQAGTYTITLRFRSSGDTEIVATCGDSSVKAQMASTNGQWVDRSFDITLQAGQQALQLAATGNHDDVRLSCWKFSKK